MTTATETAPAPFAAGDSVWWVRGCFMDEGIILGRPVPSVIKIHWNSHPTAPQYIFAEKVFRTQKEALRCATEQHEADGIYLAAVAAHMRRQEGEL